jgi:hypothetical protein
VALGQGDFALGTIGEDEACPHLRKDCRDVVLVQSNRPCFGTIGNVSVLLEKERVWWFLVVALARA